MKRTLCLLLLLCAFLCGCQTEPAPLPPANFTGSVEDYSYYHENQRDRAWEEDIITLAEAYLTNHPWLVNEETRIRYADNYPDETMVFWWENHFDQEKYDRFLAQINELIPRIPQLNDTVLPYEMQRIVNTLGDAHSNVHIQRGRSFPVSFTPFREGDETAVCAVTVPAEHAGLLYASLTAINNIPLEEIAEKMRPYLYTETETYFDFSVAEAGFSAGINNRDLLEVIGVLKESENQADYTFRTENGESVTITLAAVTKEERKAMDLLNHRNTQQIPFAWKDRDARSYWFTYLEEEDALYIRLFHFTQDSELPFSEMCAQITKLFNDRGSIGKIIVDLRSNGGGYLLNGYRRFFQLLNHRQAGNVYALVDGACMSMTTICLYNIRTSVEDAFIVGTPFGQNVPFCAYYEDTFPALPNCSLGYGVSKIQTVSHLEDYIPSNQPDILIYPSLSDYKNGIDTVLEAVLDME